MNARLRARLAKPRPLPPPADIAQFHGIIRRTTPPRAMSWPRALLLSCLLMAALMALFFGVTELLLTIVFGGAR